MAEFSFTIKTKSGDVAYFGHTLDYATGLQLGGELLDLVGAMFVPGRGVGGIISGLAKGIISKGGPEFINRIMHGVARDGVKLDASDMSTFTPYENNYGELLAALTHVLEARFGSFFDELIQERVRAMAEKFVKTSVSGGLAQLWEVPSAPLSTSGSSPSDST